MNRDVVHRPRDSCRFLAVPIMLDDAAIGVLACLSRTRREFTEADVALAPVADRAGGGGGAQCRALRRRPRAARGDRGVPARGVGDACPSPELETALRAVVRELPASCAPTPPSARCRFRRRPAAHADEHRDADDGIAGYSREGRRGRGGHRADGAASVRSDDYLADPRFTRSPEIEAWARAEGIVVDHRGARPRRRRRVIAFLWAFNRAPPPVHRAPRGDVVRPRPAGRSRHRQGAERSRRSAGAPGRRRRSSTSRAPARRRSSSAAPEGDRAPDRAGRRRRRLRHLPLERGAAWCRSWPSSPTAAPTARSGSASRRCRPALDGRVPRPRRGHPVAAARHRRARRRVAARRVVPRLRLSPPPSSCPSSHRTRSSAPGPRRTSRERRWRQDQLDLAMTIAAQVALAVDTARHYQAAQQRAAEVETLGAIGETLTSTLDLQQVLEAIADSAATLTGGQRAVVFELDQAGGALRARAIRGIDIESGFPAAAGPGGRGGGGGAALAPVWSADVLALSAAGLRRHARAVRPCRSMPLGRRAQLPRGPRRPRDQPRNGARRRVRLLGRGARAGRARDPAPVRPRAPGRDRASTMRASWATCGARSTICGRRRRRSCAAPRCARWASSPPAPRIT